MSMKELAHQFLGAAADDAKGTDLIYSQEIVSACNMDESQAAQVLDYLQEKNLIKDCVRSLGVAYPSAFRVSASGYDWLDEMDKS